MRSSGAEMVNQSVDFRVSRLACPQALRFFVRFQVVRWRLVETCRRSSKPFAIGKRSETP